MGAMGLRYSLLLETTPDGRFSHLELATPAGLLTLHPEADGTLHGNRLTADGLRHLIGLPWDRAGVVDVEGSPVADAAMAASLATAGPYGSARHPGPDRVLVLRVGTDLELSTTPTAAERLADGSWRLDPGGVRGADHDGLPALDGGESWPLELPE